MSVSRETFAYYLAEAENGWCKIPRRVADDMDLYCANLEAKLAEARKVIEPFADCNMFNDTCPDNTPAWWTGAELDETSDVTVGDFRAARRFLEETK